MKKTIIALTLVVAIAIALSITIPALAATSATATTTITGTVNKVIEVSVDKTTLTWDLTPATGDMSKSDAVSVTVNSNAAFTLNAQDLTAGTKGYMEISDAAPKLQNAFTVNGAPLTATVGLTSGTLPGSTQSVTLAQAKSWSDAPGTYGIVVTFTASN